MSKPALTVIKGTAPKPKPDYATLWKKAFCTVLLAGDETTPAPRYLRSLEGGTAE